MIICSSLDQVLYLLMCPVEETRRILLHSKDYKESAGIEMEHMSQQ